MGDRKPVDYDELFPGRFLKAGLLQGKKVTLTISSVDVEELPQDDGSKRTRGILSFSETGKQLVLNSTNGQCVKAMFGRKVVEWPGHKVTFCAEKATFGRDTVDAVRVYGSPELTGPVPIEIQLPRRKPQARTLHPFAAKRKAPPSPSTTTLAHHTTTAVELPPDEEADPDNDGR